MTRSLLAFSVALVFFGLETSSNEAAAAVGGKTYNVLVTKNFVREFDDFYSFQSDGRFISLRGGLGEWSQLNLIVLTVWFADFSAGDVEVSFVGIQRGTSLTGVGSNGDGDIFRAEGVEGPFDGVLQDPETNTYVVD